MHKITTGKLHFSNNLVFNLINLTWKSVKEMLNTFDTLKRFKKKKSRLENFGTNLSNINLKYIFFFFFLPMEYSFSPDIKLIDFVGAEFQIEMKLSRKREMVYGG